MNKYSAVTIPVIDRATNPDWKEQIAAQAKEYIRITKNIKPLKGWGGSSYQVATRYDGCYARIKQYWTKNYKTPVLYEEFDIDGNLIHTEITNLKYAH